MSTVRGWLFAMGMLALGGSLPAADLLPPERPIAEVVDYYVDARLTQEGASAAPQADDAVGIRRTMLDLVGRIPAAREVRDYMASKEPGKRERLVDRLMASPQYVEHQALVLDAIVTGSDGDVRGYLTKALTENFGWDRMFRDLILARESDPVQKEAADFLKRRVQDTDRVTVEVSVVFFGVNISCAKCHDHPLVSDWTQDHFYGMKSFFNRTFDSGGFVAEREYGLVQYKTTGGEERRAKLMFLTGQVIDDPGAKAVSADERKKMENRLKEFAKKKQPPPPPGFSAREQLVETALKAGQDHFFSRAIVNRLWHQFFGRGLVMPLDQMHAENPASHPELLDWLARDLREHKYDLRRLVRGLVLSRAYARSSRWPSAGEAPRASLFATAQLRPLTPEQYARSLSLATADPGSFEGDVKPEELSRQIVEAARPRDANRFEQPRTDFQISADEALLLSNNEQMANSYLGGGLFNRLKKMDARDQVIETAVWSILSRPVTEEEKKLLGDYVAARDDRPDAARRQLIWILLTSTEFRFNH